MGYGGYGDHAARPPALFMLVLGANGGTLAPTSVDQIRVWIEQEVQSWQPFFQTWQQHQQGRNQNIASLKSAIEWARQPLLQAHAAVQNVSASNGKISEADIQRQLQQCKSHLQDAFVNRILPHTSSSQGKRLLGLSAEPSVALGYAYAVVAAGHNQLLTHGDANIWRGFLMGLQDRYEVITDTDARLSSEKEALADLRARAEDTITQKGLAADELHRRYEALVDGVTETDGQQKQDFQALLDRVNDEHAKAFSAHATEMGDLKRAFKEAMALRGPVNYWRRKARKHRLQGRRQMIRSFQSIGGLALGLGLMAIWTFWTVNEKGVPDAWKLSVLILMAVLGIWALRLVIRMWLSNAHLATDAEERVTMVQTYLALLEDGKMTKDEDRALVLAPLFRPAADGLVKDEGLPHPVLEMLTRTGRS